MANKVVKSNEERLMVQIAPEVYKSSDEYTIRREYGKTPAGYKLNGQWVLRNQKGEMIDFDRYLNDLSERNNLEI